MTEDNRQRVQGGKMGDTEDEKLGRWEAESKEKKAGKRGSLENRRVGRSNPIQLDQLNYPSQPNKFQLLENRNKNSIWI